jgi:hypothetical protein
MPKKHEFLGVTIDLSERDLVTECAKGMTPENCKVYIQLGIGLMESKNFHLAGVKGLVDEIKDALIRFCERNFVLASFCD